MLNKLWMILDSFFFLFDFILVCFTSSRVSRHSSYVTHHFHTAISDCLCVCVSSLKPSTQPFSVISHPPPSPKTLIPQSLPGLATLAATPHRASVLARWNATRLSFPVTILRFKCVSGYTSGLKAGYTNV